MILNVQNVLKMYDIKCTKRLVFYVQNAVMCCFLHSLWLITWKQLLTVPLTHYVITGRWIKVLWNEQNIFAILTPTLLQLLLHH